MEEELNFENIKVALETKYEEWLIENIKKFPEQHAKDTIQIYNRLLVCESLLGQIKHETKSKKIKEEIQKYFDSIG